ncbi:MAG: sulfite exporter TauE/SafE family protein [Bacteroidetes bacterium]|mgnify:FL=1|jgi:uncharacterized protein|nr:sulfite exporter TauE/SafE family protein [Bacteroidota bacterium]MBT6686904.1 sulfite exporter TauE/SafE family protein [Bacteroidota bacterium]MBT7144198.1 sulfite exporter TauE/SafE family protein [Bacteroidota bacterium]MBT7491581.1 sulfite exporter TauE/SafE family protein [Bacteroidota bacterium]
MQLVEILSLVLIGLLAGFISGGFGVGGGIIIVPALVFFLGLSQQQAQGTSLALMVFPIGLISAFNYFKAGQINIKFVLIIVVAFFIGSYFGSIIALKLPAKLLRQIFGIIMLIAAFKMIFSK